MPAYDLSTPAAPVQRIPATGVIATQADIAAAQTPVTSIVVTANYTLQLSDANKTVECNNTAAINVTIPPNSSVAFPIGTVIEIISINTGAPTVALGSGVTGNISSSSGILRTRWSVGYIRKRATDTWVYMGDFI